MLLQGRNQLPSSLLEHQKPRHKPSPTLSIGKHFYIYFHFLPSFYFSQVNSFFKRQSGVVVTEKCIPKDAIMSQFTKIKAFTGHVLAAYCLGFDKTGKLLITVRAEWGNVKKAPFIGINYYYYSFFLFLFSISLFVLFRSGWR